MNTKISSPAIFTHIDKNQHVGLPQILTFDELDSTNNYLMSNAKHFEQANVACFAESQTAGRGRLGRTWVSPATANIYLSLLWHFQLTRSELAGLNIVVAVSIIEALTAVTNLDNFKVKWPNDIYYDDKKLAGILIETAEEVNGISTVVIGLGINVNMPETITENDITKPWIDLATITQQPVSRNHLAAELLVALTKNMRAFELHGAEPFVKKVNALDYLKNKKITVTSGVAEYTGIAGGIDSNGQLLLTTHDNHALTISAGEASILIL